jgi:hypothetical protein
MKTLIVTYELVAVEKNYSKLVAKIKAYESWAELSLFAYLILTNSTVQQVRDNLATVLDPKDKLFVGTCPVPAAWQGLPENVSKWILENQPKNS